MEFTVTSDTIKCCNSMTMCPLCSIATVNVLSQREAQHLIGSEGNQIALFSPIAINTGYWTLVLGGQSLAPLVNIGLAALSV